MAALIGRNSELGKLKSVFECNIRNCYIDSKPRMGASSLVKKFCEGTRSITITFPEGTRKMAIQAFGCAIQEYVKEPVAADNFPELFRCLSVLARESNPIIIFDKTHFAPEDFPPALKEFSDNNDYMIILIGNGDSERYDITFSEKITLDELTVQDCRKIHQKMVPLDALKTYMIVGGVPAYHSILNKSEFEDNVDKAFLGNYPKLCAEAENILRRSSVPYPVCCAILWDIANCMGRPVDIANREEISRQLCDIYLKKLIEEGLIYAITPVGNAPKKPVYVIKHPLIAFYFITIRANQMFNAAEKLEFRDIQASIDLFMELRFRDICEEYLRKHYNCVKIGRWWLKEEDTSKPTLVAIIDIDGIQKTIVADCKFRFDKIDSGALKALVSRAEQISEVPEKSLMMFSISGFDEKVLKKAKNDNVVLVGPEGLL